MVNRENNLFYKTIWYIFFALVLSSLLTPVWVFKEPLFPYITSKAFFFRIVIEAALPFYYYCLFVNPKLRPKLTQPLNLAVLIFLVINIITSVAGVNVSRSFLGNFERMGGTWYLAHLTLLFFYVQAVGQAGGKYLKIFLQSFIGVAVVLTLNGFSGKVGGPVFIEDPSLPFRVSSTFGNPIFFASYLIVPLFLAVYFALQEAKRGLKVAYWITAVLLLLGVYISGTRGAVVGVIAGLLVSLIVYILLAGKSKFRKYGLVAFGLLLVVSLGLYGFKNKLPQGSILYRVFNLRDSNTEARLIQWRMALQGAKEHLLLGVGPENYYVIFDKFYDPEMYKYDASWFDKPHNYPLEILVTNGIFGFLSYALMFVFALYALWKAYKSGLLSLLEMSALFAGMVAYQTQNLTVFDTVSASGAFFAFIGLCAFLWTESFENFSQDKNQDKPRGEGFIPKAALVVFLGLIFYVEYVSNFYSMQASKRVNFGQAYGLYDVKTAANYFESALSVPSNLDPEQVANYYSNFTASMVSSSDSKLDKNFVLEQLQKATASQRAITQKIKNDPILWMRLAMDEINLASFQGKSVEAAKDSINQGVALAPKRAEVQQLWIQYYSALLDWKSLAPVAENMVRLNPYNSELRWQLAMAYYLNGQMEQAVKAGDQAVSGGYKFSQLQQFAWYVQYYLTKKDYQKVIPLLEKAVELQPNEIGLFVDLAKAYAQIGDMGHAKALAQQVAKSDPSKAAAMDEFIKSLK